MLPRLVRRAPGLLGLIFALWASGLPAGEQTDFPKAARDRYEQAQELMKQKRFKEAVDAFEDAIKLGMKDYPRAHLNQAKSLLELEEYDNAITFYTNFLTKFGPEDSCRL